MENGSNRSEFNKEVLREYKENYNTDMVGY